MCSNKWNNRGGSRHHITHRNAPAVAAAAARVRKPTTRPLRRPAVPSAAVSAAVAALSSIGSDAPTPLPQRPAAYQPIPAFNPGPTLAAQQAHAAVIENADGLSRAQALTAAHAPASLYSHEALEHTCARYGALPAAHQLVRENIWAYSTMRQVVDLRDDQRYPDGNAIRRGPILSADTAAHCTKVHMEIFVEIRGNVERALWEICAIAHVCPALRELHVAIIGDGSGARAREIMQDLQAEFASWKTGFSAAVRLDFSFTSYWAGEL